MAYSYVTYVGDGSTVNFSVPFPYIKKADVDVLVDGTSVSFTWLTSSTVQCASPPADQSAVVVKRVTEKAEREVDFTNASILDEATLDKDSNQLFFIAQEAFDELISTMNLDIDDDKWDANSKIIKNLAAGVADHDAVRYDQLGTFVTACQAAQTAAETAETNAETAEANAVTAKTNAETAEANAETAESNAEYWATQIDQGKVYRADATETDQGATGNGTTIKAYVDSLSGSKGTIILGHTGAGSTTTYTLTTSTTVPAGVRLIIENGAVLNGAGTLTLNGPLEAERYPIFGSTITVSGRPKISRIYPEWWGENSTPGTTDMTTEIQSAINLAELTLDSWHTSIDVDLAPTTYFVSSTLVIDATGVGIGCNSGGKAVLRRTGNYGATLSINPSGASYVHHNVIHDISMHMQTNDPESGDIHLLVEAGSLTTIKDCYLVDGWQQIVLKGCLKARLTRVQTLATDLLGTFQSGAGFIELTESSTAPVANNSNVAITDCDFNCGEARANCYYGSAFKISAVDGLWVSGCHFHRSGNLGIYFTPAGAASQISSVKFNNCYIDSQGNANAGYGTGISFNGSSSSTMRDIKFTNCEILDGQGDGDSTYGVIFNSGAAYFDVSFNNCTISSWGHDGMRLYSTSSKDISVNGCHIYQNDVDAEDASGIKIITGSSFLRICNNSIGSETCGNGNQLYGIYAGGTLDDCIIVGNLVKGNGTDTITIVGTQTRCTVANNEDT